MSIDTATGAWSAGLPRPAADPDPPSGQAADRALARHQAWMREYERAAQAGTASPPHRGPHWRPGLVEAAEAPRAPWAGGAAAFVHPQAAQVPGAAGPRTAAGPAGYGAAAVPAVPAARALVDPPNAAAVPARPVDAPVPRGLRAGAPTVQDVPPAAATPATPARGDHDHDYAARHLLVRRDGEVLDVVIRDARLAPHEALSVLRELLLLQPAPGIRRISLTLNGRTAAPDLAATSSHLQEPLPWPSNR
ncbi:MAG: hypothetical protein EPO12_05425 [Aquabacterium sp.]|nr:MAG: hypothetical protein EPO12_05425 [Aquabacterium sp.]